MSEEKKQSKKYTVKKRVLPPQQSPTDISNWVDRPLNTPNGRVIIESDQTQDGVVIAE